MKWGILAVAKTAGTSPRSDPELIAVALLITVLRGFQDKPIEHLESRSGQEGGLALAAFVAAAETSPAIIQMVYRKRLQLPGTLASLAVLIAAVFFTSSSTQAGGFSENHITQLKRAVVIVTTYDAQGNALLQGSGFFIDADQVVTSLHVIKNANQIRLETFSGASATVQSVVATNKETDLALLRLAQPCPDIAILPLVSTPPHEGEAIMLVSSPLGSRWKVTQGNVGLLWEFSGISNRLQITAAIAPGSSGGPVVNEQGQVIGIAALYVNSVEDLNFAVPVASLRDLRAQAKLIAVHAN